MQRQSEWMLLGRKERRIFYGKEAMCVRTKVRLSKSILRERERERIDFFNFSLHDFFLF
jgi:hypothetical protein